MKSRRKIFLVFSIVLSIIIYTIILIYLFPYPHKTKFIYRFINLKPFGAIPGWLVLYLTIFAFSLIIYFIFTLCRKIELSRIESELANTIETSNKPNPQQISQLIYQMINLIYQRIKELESEIQSLAVTPNLVENETKEQILEKERKRVARELHDSVSQDLFAGMMMVSALEKQVELKKINLEQVSSQLTIISTAISEAQNEMRALLLHLRPLALEDKTLRQGIMHLVSDLETKVKAKIVTDVDNVYFNRNIEDNIFRMIQEIISNILRHAQANQILIFLKKKNHEVIIRIEDNGIGFDPKQENNRSYGLNNIKERAISIGGSCKIVSLKNKGTSVIIKIPIIESKSND